MHPPQQESHRLRTCVYNSESLSRTETRDPSLGEIGRAFRAIRELKSLGWVVGCDSELLPPLWALREFDGN